VFTHVFFLISHGDSVLSSRSTLARYHPAKRFHLAVASFGGALTVYDTHVKKPYFQKMDCHEAPLKDLCMSAARPDLVVTAGYDNIINIYDTRTRSTQYSIESNHPFSTVAMSGCGDYLAVGNLKGEIIAYDFRKLEKVMNVKNLSQSTINRVAFVPTNGEHSEKPLKLEDTRVSLLMDEPSAPVEVETTTHSKRDSFVDFLGFMDKKSDNNEYMSRISIGSNTSLASGVRMSCGTRLSQDWRPNNHNELFDEMFDDQPSNVNTQRLKKRQKDLNATVVDSIVEPKPNAKRYSLQHQSRVPDLSQIVESDDKENSDDFKTPDTTHRQPLKNDIHVTRRSSESTIPTPLVNISNASNVHDLGKRLRDEFQTVKSEILTEIRQDLAGTVREELKKFEMSNAFDVERNKYHTFSVIFNTSRQLERQIGHMQANVDTVMAGMSLLLQDDPFVQAYVRMKNENDELRRRLAEYEDE
jgi:protein NEDD1